MSYSFRKSESARDSIRRIAEEQLKQAVRHLQNAEDKRVEAVHQTRKCLKRLRTLLRLIPERQGDWKGPAQETLKSVAQRLAVFRDTDSLHLMLERLQIEHEPELGPAEFAEAFRTLDQRRTVAHSLESELPSLLGLAEELYELLQEVAEWDLSSVTPRVVLDSVQDRYGRGRKLLKKVMRSPTHEELHSWRKFCKDHEFHLHLLTPLWPAILTARRDEVSRLCRLLGDDHDLALLHQALQHAGDANTSESKESPLVRLIVRQRGGLLRPEFRLGRRVFAEKKRAMGTRLQQFWQIWKSR